MKTSQTRSPRRRPKDQKRIPLSMRITPGVRERLAEEAEMNGRSITQEAEFRLEQSFARQALLGEVLDLAYGRLPAAILVMIARAMDDAGKSAGFSDWPKNPDAVEHVKEAVCEILSAF